MRKAFFEKLGNLSETDNNVYLLTGDLGFNLFDSFRAKKPDRFYNVGVAESNMIGIAAGLALSGKTVFCYSIIPFLIMRAFEQVRVDVAFNNLNVKLVGSGAGLSYGLEGITHFALEDLALMRVLPNMTVVVPADPFEAERIAEISYESPSPFYIRLGKTGEPAIHKSVPDLKIGKGMLLREGKDVAIFAIGSMCHVCLKVVDMLAKRGVSATLINMHTIKPLDEELIKEITLHHRIILSVEEHSIIGGLGSALAEVLSESSYQGRYTRIGLPVELEKHIGRTDYLREKYNLTADSILARVVQILKE